MPQASSSAGLIVSFTVDLSWLGGIDSRSGRRLDSQSENIGGPASRDGYYPLDA
jgi:predicted aconitase with swiveling domain